MTFAGPAELKLRRAISLESPAANHRFMAGAATSGFRLPPGPGPRALIAAMTSSARSAVPRASMAATVSRLGNPPTEASTSLRRSGRSH